MVWNCQLYGQIHPRALYSSTTTLRTAEGAGGKAVGTCMNLMLPGSLWHRMTLAIIGLEGSCCSCMVKTEPVAYCFWRFMDAGTIYAQIQKECLASFGHVNTLKNTCLDFIFTEFVIFKLTTDHKALIPLMNSP